MTQAEIKTKIAELKKKSENPSLPESAKAALEKMITDLDNKLLESELKEHKGGSTTAKEEEKKLKKEGYKKRGDKYIKEEKESQESEEWKDKLYDLIYSDVPEAQKEWDKLSDKKKKEFIEYCYDLATDFSNAGNWENGKKPTKSEVKNQLLEVVEPKQKETKSDKKEQKSDKKSTGEYNCDELIAEAKERKAKAKKRAEERASEPKKTEGTKAKEKVEKTHGAIEKLIESGKLKKAQIEKILAETKDLVKLLEKALKSL